jgi:endoglucanase
LDYYVPVLAELAAPSPIPYNFKTMRQIIFIAAAAFCCLASVKPCTAAEAFVRVSQVGYETGQAPYRAYLMSTVAPKNAEFVVVDEKGKIVYSAAVGAQLGTWSNSASLSYRVYALDFTAPEGSHYSIAVSGSLKAHSPSFAVASPEALYAGLLINAKFFYETEHDGPSYIKNTLRSAPGHLNDAHAKVYKTPPLDDNDMISTTGKPLNPTGAVIDATGGWWDAGDYMKYVETISYTLALQEIGVRDFPKQMGPGAPFHPPAPPNALSFSGDTPGAPSSADFSSEAQFGIDFLLKMWDDKSKTLYYQVGNSQDWDNFDFLSDYDIWRLPQADDDWTGCPENSTYICHRPVFQAAPAGSKISPNLAGRLAADFALCYLNNQTSNPSLAATCLKNAEDIFDLADLSLSDPANSVDSGSCPSGCLLTIIPFDGYPETVWSDDMELGATELYFALQSAKACGKMPSGLRYTNPALYLGQAAKFAKAYIANIYANGGTDTLNLYDVSGLAHFELYRALHQAGNPQGLAIDEAAIRAQFLEQVDDAIAQAGADAWGFGDAWNSDTTSHGGGLSVMASQAFYLTGNPKYNLYAQRWMANVLGANPWGSSFIVGDGSATFPNCIQHQVANLAGSLDGTSRGTPVLWGAASEGPSYSATSGLVDGMILCPANGVDTFAQFNGNDGAYNAGAGAVYQDNMQSYTTTEPAVDLTATSFLMWSWRIAGRIE